MIHSVISWFQSKASEVTPVSQDVDIRPEEDEDRHFQTSLLKLKPQPKGNASAVIPGASKLPDYIDALCEIYANPSTNITSLAKDYGIDRRRLLEYFRLMPQNLPIDSNNGTLQVRRAAMRLLKYTPSNYSCYTISELRDALKKYSTISTYTRRGIEMETGVKSSCLKKYMRLLRESFDPPLKDNNQFKFIDAIIIHSHVDLLELRGSGVELFLSDEEIHLIGAMASSSLDHTIKVSRGQIRLMVRDAIHAKGSEMIQVGIIRSDTKMINRGTLLSKSKICDTTIRRYTTEVMQPVRTAGDFTKPFIKVSPISLKRAEAANPLLQSKLIQKIKTKLRELYDLIMFR